MSKQILDACCGSRMFWFDKKNSQALFCDNRNIRDTLCDGRTLEVNPDVLCDFTKMPFGDESFWHVVFDPPHLVKVGETSWLAKKYGKLPKEWQKAIHDGFWECWRVLKPNGTLVFKWNETDISVSEIIKAIGKEPMYGQKTKHKGKTHWLCFVKAEKDNI